MSENDQITGGEAEGSNPTEMLRQVAGILLHRRWWFLSTASVVILAGIAWFSRTPNRYTSDATIIVTQQQVPERYVVPTSTTNLTKDLETMEGEVLSRTRLFSLIDEFGLYPKEKKRLAPEQLLKLVMNNIKIEPLNSNPQTQKDADSFRISFTAENPSVAQAVTSRLASLFILNNVKGREDQAVNTTKFLKEQLETAQRKLSDMEQNLRDFKMQHLGELPEQQPGNLAILGGLQTQLQNTTASIARAEQQRVYLESLINTLHGMTTSQNARAASAQPGPGELAPTDEAVLGAELRLAHLKNEKKSLQSLRGPDDPEVTKLNVDIARTQALLQKLKAAMPPAQQAAAEDTEDATTAQLKSQLQANRVELENLTRDERQLKQSIAQYQNRLNQTPIREQQLSGLVRDIELVKGQYADLLNKEQQSQLAASLEQQQGGEQFRLVEPPSLPTLPSSPQRVKLGAGVGLAGIVFGFVVAFLADLKYRAYYAESDLRQSSSVPLLIGLPLFLTLKERRKRMWRRGFELACGCILCLMICGAELAYLKNWHILG